MNTEQILIPGTLLADGTLILEQRPTLPAGRVEVLIRTVSGTGAAGENWWDFLQRSRAEMIAHGYTFRTKEEIDDEREKDRALDEDRSRSLERLQGSRE